MFDDDESGEYSVIEGSNSSHRETQRRKYSRSEDNERSSQRRERERSPTSRHDFKRVVDEPLPELFSIHRGKIATIQDYGAFVQLDGMRRQGLIHISQLSSHRTESAREVVDQGEKVWVKVISIEDNKIGLSLKHVNQTTGEDQDQNQVAYEQESKRGRVAKVQERVNTEKLLDPLYIMQSKDRIVNAVKIGAQKIYGDKDYDLLPECDGAATTSGRDRVSANQKRRHDDDDDDEDSAGDEDRKQAHKSSKKKDKKEKRDKKEKKKEKKEKKEEKKHKKHKKHHDSD